METPESRLAAAMERTRARGQDPEVIFAAVENIDNCESPEERFAILALAEREIRYDGSERVNGRGRMVFPSDLLAALEETETLRKQTEDMRERAEQVRTETRRMRAEITLAEAEIRSIRKEIDEIEKSRSPEERAEIARLRGEIADFQKDRARAQELLGLLAPLANVAGILPPLPSAIIGDGERVEEFYAQQLKVHKLLS